MKFNKRVAKLMARLACLPMITSSIGCAQIHAMEIEENEFIGDQILCKSMDVLRNNRNKLKLVNLLKAAFWIVKWSISGGEKDLNADKDLIIRDLKKSLVTNNENLPGVDIKPEQMEYEPLYKVSLDDYNNLFEPIILRFFELGGYQLVLGCKLHYSYKPFWSAINSLDGARQELLENVSVFNDIIEYIKISFEKYGYALE